MPSKSPGSADTSHADGALLDLLKMEEIGADEWAGDARDIGRNGPYVRRQPPEDEDRSACGRISDTTPCVEEKQASGATTIGPRSAEGLAGSEVRSRTNALSASRTGW
jgi:hypothetical protein